MGRWILSYFLSKLRKGFYFYHCFGATGYRKALSRWKFFKDSEVDGLKDDFIIKLEKAREIADIPFVITSGYRTLHKNESVIGAVPDSSHTKGLAVDLRVRSTRETALILDAAKSAGIDRRGIYVDSYWNPRHVHLDTDPEKVSNVIFIKLEEN